jgi:formylglycine-generating enzyme required for sulfatase activity
MATADTRSAPTQNPGAASTNVGIAMKTPGVFVCILTAACCLSVTASRSEEGDSTATPAADSMSGKEPGDVRDDNGLKMKLVWCPPGFVKMESVERITEAAAQSEDNPNDDDEVDPQEEPEPRLTTKVIPVKVIISRGFWLGKFEVTQREWKTVMETEPWKEQRRAKEGNDMAATYICWLDAMAFCRKLTTRERKAGRLADEWEYTLPTEAQWERACRARTGTQFHFGDDASKLVEFAWCRENAWDAGEMYAHRVGQKKPNAWGLFDMHGNANEWCRDYFADALPGGRDPEVTVPGEYTSRVIRGGCWSSIPSSCRSSRRHSNAADDRDWYLGLRVALSFVKPAQ